MTEKKHDSDIEMTKKETKRQTKRPQVTNKHDKK